MSILIPETLVYRMNGIDCVMDEARKHDNHFFDPGTLAAFRSIVDDETFIGKRGTYFVTSEQQSGDFWRGTGMDCVPKAFGSTAEELEQEYPRTYTVRRATLTDRGFTIEAPGKGFQAFGNRADAIEFARHLAYDDHECEICGGPLVPCDYEVGFIHKGQPWTDLAASDHLPVRREPAM